MALSGGPMAFPGYLRGGFDAVSDLPKACSIDTCAYTELIVRVCN